MVNLDLNKKLRNLRFLPGSSEIQESYQEIQESRIFTRKSRNPGFLPGNSGIQGSSQENQDSPESQTLGILCISGLSSHRYSVIFSADSDIFAFSTMFRAEPADFNFDISGHT